MSYPFPGWNEGFTTTAPIIFLIRKGQTQIPANEKLILDITPVDQVASVMLAVAAQACVEEPQLVYQAATGDSNPNNMERIIGLVGLDKRRHFEEKDTGVKILNQIAARMEPRPVTTSHFENTSVPMFNSAAKKASSLLDRVRPRWGGGRVGEVIDRGEEQCRTRRRADARNYRSVRHVSTVHGRKRLRVSFRQRALAFRSHQ